MIQITPQMKILVAIEAVDGRKGIDSLARLCEDKLQTDPFSGCISISKPARHIDKTFVLRRSRVLAGTEAAVEGTVCVVA